VKEKLQTTIKPRVGGHQLSQTAAEKRAHMYYESINWSRDKDIPSISSLHPERAIHFMRYL